MRAVLIQRLRAVLSEINRAAVAVSGGVDSLTLGVIAADMLGDRVAMHHAISPAVPCEATERTRMLAATRGWTLHVFDAGEFADASYRSNPVDRCFFCKINLYGAIAARTSAQVLSGTNLDDLGEYRPGLDAAARYGVRHPFVEAGFAKRDVRALAAHLGLGAIAELPAAPCLSSRIETGIGIEAPMLAAVHAAERSIAAMLPVATVRCRVRGTAIVVELDADALATLDPATEAVLRRDVAALFEPIGIRQPVAFAPYRNGSAFLRPIAMAAIS